MSSEFPKSLSRAPSFQVGLGVGDCGKGSKRAADTLGVL